MSSKLENKLIAKSISKLYLESRTSDIQFAFTSDNEAGKVPAHKSILAVASAVFDRMFYGPMKETNVVEVKDASPNGFKEFLQFFYLPEVTLTMDNIEEVAHLTDKYDLLDGIKSCVAFIESRLIDGNIIWGYQLAISLQNEKLKEFCEKRIQLLTKNALYSDSFFNCDRTVLEQILRLNSLCSNEIDLFYACIEWAKLSCRKDGLDEQHSAILRNQLGECFHLISFGVMASEEIASILSNELLGGMFSRDELRDLFQMKILKNFKSNIFNHLRQRGFQWDFCKIMVCSLGDIQTSSCATLQTKESTCFSTNSPILLTGFECFTVSGMSGNVIEIDAIITIIEYPDLSFSTKLPYNVVYAADPVTLNGKPVVIHEPVVIQPNKIYEIRLAFATKWGALDHYVHWKSTVKLNGDLTITIHRHPSANTNQRCNNNRSGSVTALHFYQKLNFN